MSDIEAIVRRIVARSDVNTITKRMVRREYKCHKGQVSLSAAEKGEIKAALDKIISELTEKLQSEIHLDSTAVGCETLEEENTCTHDVKKQLADDQQKLHMMENQDDSSKQNKACVNVKSKIKQELGGSRVLDNNVDYESTNEKSIVLAHLPSKSTNLKLKQVSMINKQMKPKLLTSSEALTYVLDSDWSVDTSGSEFYESPQKITFVEKVSIESDLKGVREKRTKNGLREMSANKCNVLDMDNSDLEKDMTSAKKYKVQEQGLDHIFALKSDEHTSLLANQDSCSFGERNVNNFIMDLCSKSRRSSSPQGSCKKSSYLDFLELNNQKGRQDCVIDVSSENSESHQSDVDLPRSHFSGKKEGQMNVKCKQQKKSVYVFHSSSDTESSIEKGLSSVAERWLRHGAHVDLQKHELETRCPISDEICDRSSGQCVPDSLFQTRKDGLDEESWAHHNGNESGQESDVTVVMKPEHSTCPSSDSSSSSFSMMKRRKMLKKKTRKAIFDDSDSEPECTDSVQNYVKSYKTKRGGKDVKVLIKIVDENTSGIDEIKYAVVSDSEVLDNLESKALKKTKRKRKGNKEGKSLSFSENKGKIMKQKIAKQNNRSVEMSSSGSSTDENKESSQKIKCTCDINQGKTTCSNVNDHSHCSSGDDDDNAEHVTTSSILMPHQDSGSEGSSSSLSDIPRLYSSQKCIKDKNLSTVNKKPSQNSELSRLRAVCRTAGLILRNTKELAGCVTDDDKVRRIKQLLKEKGIKGRPSIKKAEELNLLKEMRELKCEEVTSNSREEGRRRRRVNGDFFGSAYNSPGRQRDIFRRNSQNVFSDLKDVITIDDSDSS